MRFWHQQHRFYVATTVVWVLVAALTWEPWLAALDVIAVYFAFHNGRQFMRAKASELRHRMLAWQVETNETLAGMAASGLYESPLEALDALRDSPPPPGMKPDEWAELHDHMVAEIRKQHGDG